MNLFSVPDTDKDTWTKQRKTKTLSIIFTSMSMVKALGILSLPKAIADGLLILWTILDIIVGQLVEVKMLFQMTDRKEQLYHHSPDELILLQSELERTRIKKACFVESMPLGSVPEPAKTAYFPLKGSMDSSSRNYRGTNHTGTPSFSWRR